MAEPGGREGQPHPANKPEVKPAAGTLYKVDSAATPRQQLTESGQRREASKESLGETLKSSAEMLAQTDILGIHLRRDTVIPQWFQASKAAAASDGHAVHC